MPSLTLTVKYTIADELVISASAFLDSFLHGIPLTDTDGNPYSILQIKDKIKFATVQLEHFLNMKITEQQVTEVQDYIYEEWINWSHVKLEQRINEIISFSGYLNSTKVVDFPLSILTFKGKSISIVPSSNNVGALIWFNNAGAYPMLHSGVNIVPNFWHITYKTGFKIVPYDLLQAVCKMASIQILAVLGDILLGAGIASESLSFDGLSQSISTTQSAENSAYSARIKQYANELKDDLRRLSNYYRGVIFETV